MPSVGYIKNTPAPVRAAKQENDGCTATPGTVPPRRAAMALKM